MMRPVLTVGRFRRRNRQDAPAAAQESPPGSLTPEARHQLDGALAEGMARQGAEDERSVTDVIADVPERNFRAAPRHAPTEALQGSTLLASPTAEPLAAPDGGPQPSWSPRPARPNAETRAIPLPVGGRPYVRGRQLDKATPVTITAGPEIGDSLTVPAAGPAQAALFDAAPPRPTILPYTVPGWAGLQMSRWVTRGEWEELPAIVERGLGRNAAEAAAGFRHSRETIAGQVRQWFAANGNPDLADDLLRRTHELVMAARVTVAEVGAL